MFADLHLHTNFSDGTYTPEELAGHAIRLRFKAVALTDHDTMEGCPRMAAACQAGGVEFIPASELTTEHAGHELHMLGYFLDAKTRSSPPTSRVFRRCGATAFTKWWRS